MKTFFALLAVAALGATGCQSTHHTDADTNPGNQLYYSPNSPNQTPPWPPPSTDTMNHPPTTVTPPNGP